MDGAIALRFEDLRRGDRATVVAVGEKDGPMRRLQEMGLTAGASFRVVKVAPLGDPVEIDLRGYRLCIRKREARGLEIRRAD